MGSCLAERLGARGHTRHERGQVRLRAMYSNGHFFDLLFQIL